MNLVDFTSNEQEKMDLEKMEPIYSNYVSPGRIMWLPTRREMYPLVVRPVRGANSVHESIYGRPVLVISRPAEARHVVHFLSITAFGGQSIEECFGSDPAQCRLLQATHIPIYPSSPSENDTPKGSDPSRNGKFLGKSYINARDVFSTDWRLLKTYPQTSLRLRSEDHRLDNASLNALLRCSRRLSGYLPGPQMILNAQAPLKVPNRAVTSQWHPPPVPIRPWPRTTSSESKAARPILSVVIPGKEEPNYGTIQTRQIREPEPKSSYVVDDCMAAFTSKISSMLLWAGSSLTQAWRKRAPNAHKQICSS